MATIDLKKFLLSTSLMLSVAAFTAPQAYAQETGDDPVETVDPADEQEETESSGDVIQVTGTRVKNSDTFNSIAPVQVITTDVSRDLGLIDPVNILQESEVAAGQQIDTTFQGFVLDNGPGSETLNLRGLGASRTLILINGRRMAPGGVEGAPTTPSINLLPGSLIERYDLLLDGASSVYGSDAVAGVGNAILRKDFDGFEFFGSGDYAEAGAGNDWLVSGAWGKSNDRGFIGIGAEYDFTEAVTFADRDFLAGCDTHYEITETGEIRTLDVATDAYNRDVTNGLVGAKMSPCYAGSGGYTDRLFEQSGALFGSAYYTPGAGNLLADYSDTGSIYSIPVDADGDGIEDVYFPDFSPGSRDLQSTLYPEQRKASVMAYGEYTFEGDMNITPFFEALYTNLQVDGNSGVGAVFPDVPADNQFNPCNPAAPGGVDCGLAEDALMANPNFIAAFQAYYDFPDFITPANYVDYTGVDLLTGPLGAIPVTGTASIRGDRNLTEVELEQLRFVGGLTGDLPFLNRGSLNNWSFEASYVFSENTGSSSRMGIRDDRLALALGWDPTADVDGDGVLDSTNGAVQVGLPTLPGGPCDWQNAANPNLLTPEVTDGCVPVNMFAPSVYSISATGIPGEFATQAERDYLFDSRDFDTTYKQQVFNAFITGELGEWKAGAINAVLGVEYRTDKIVSTPDNIAADGLFFGFFVDQGAEGEKWTREVFAELDVPIFADEPIARELSVNLSGRFTEDEYYGGAWTYAVKGGWRPVDPLLLKASFGTSFRAPNLRENFLRGQSGFNTVGDPCAAPDEAFDFSGTYQASEDDRVQNNPEIIANCIREGRDPTSVGRSNNQSLTSASVEITRGGSLELDPETSESFTTGFSFEQPWFDNFDLNLNVNYYDIEIENTIVEPSTGFIVADCFLRTDGIRSPFCDRLTYNGTAGLISDIDGSFINQDKETVTGLDYNLRFAKEFTFSDRIFDLGINLRANQLKERTYIFVGDNLEITQTEVPGRFGFPEWTGSGEFRVDYDDFRFTWSTRYIGDVAQDPDSVDLFGDAYGVEYDFDDDGVVDQVVYADTCLGTEAGDTRCRNIGFADEWFEHSASIRYDADTWILRLGVRNIFDEKPPLVDGNEVFSISNTPIGNGYDLDGRQYFGSLTYEF